MAFCKIVIANVGGIDSCKYIIKTKKVKKSVIKTGCEQKMSKNYNCLNKNIAFSKHKYSSMYKPPPPRKIWRKGLLTKNKPQGLLSEFYGIFPVAPKLFSVFSACNSFFKIEILEIFNARVWLPMTCLLDWGGGGGGQCSRNFKKSRKCHFPPDIKPIWTQHYIKFYGH